MHAGMSPTLSCSIMAHPKRAEMVAELQGWLDRPVEPVWDKVNNRHETGYRAMAAFDPSCTHHLVIQDDIVPCRDLIAGAERAIASTPGDVPVSFYVGKVRPFSNAIERVVARADGASWITMQGIYWGPAVAIPTAVLADMLEWYQTSKVTNYDRRMSKWFEQSKTRCWYSWPNLVDHRGDESLAHKTAALRRSYSFLGADRSALDVDWSGGVVDILRTDQLDRARQRQAKR